MKLRLLILGLSLSACIHSTRMRAAYIWAWGFNNYGEASVPSNLTNAIAVSAGGIHSLALLADGTVAAWGDNSSGQCNVPTSLTNVVAISAGFLYSLALKADGSVTAWGYNYAGECNVPSNLVGVISVAAGSGYGTWNGGTWRGSHSLALKADGTVAAWGYDGEGETDVPANLTNVIAVSAGALHSLALRVDGTVAAWGYNFYGQCNVPSDLTNAIAISAGGLFSMALRANGTVTAWGCLNANFECSLPPDPPADLTNAIAISAGAQTGGAVRADGTVAVWGFQVPQIGLPPPGLSGVTSISASSDFTTYLALASSSPAKPAIAFIAPLEQTVAAGSQAFFSVSATGSPPLSYQWYFGSAAITAGTNRWLVLNSPQSGTYYVVVSNAVGSTKSQSVLLSVVPTININMVPDITLKGSVGSTYRIDYVNSIGPTNAWTTLATVTLTNSPSYYFDVSAIGQPARLYRLVQLP